MPAGARCAIAVVSGAVAATRIGLMPTDGMMIAFVASTEGLPVAVGLQVMMLTSGFASWSSSSSAASEQDGLAKQAP